jgi:non-heme chloroperoxidase
MPYITVGQENSGSIDLYYEDNGSGPPVVLVHGWPLSGASWEKQVAVLLDSGHRVITYDRRGFGQSSKPAKGYNYDTFAADLHKLLTTLDLRDVALVGFSMGGGEVARYLGTYGSRRVSKAVFISAIPPFLLKTSDNPSGLDSAVFQRIEKAVIQDRPAFLAAFLADFYNADVLKGTRVSDQVIQYSWNIAVAASPKGTAECPTAWMTDFRKDLSRIDVPTLVVHGDSDRILPITATGVRTHEAVKGSHLMVVKEGPHGLNWTHADELNPELVDFLSRDPRVQAA